MTTVHSDQPVGSTLGVTVLTLCGRSLSAPASPYSGSHPSGTLHTSPSRVSCQPSSKRQGRVHAPSRRSALSSPRFLQDVSEIRAIGDNTGCMALKGANPGHAGDERADGWSLYPRLQDVAARWHIDPERDLVQV
jgi:hypothetical protein